MKKTSILLALGLFPYLSFSQHAVDKIDRNTEWKNYTTFTEKTYNGPLLKNDIQYDLLDGKIATYRILQNNEIEAEIDVKYLNSTTVEQEVKIYDSGRGTIREVVYKHELRFDDKKNIIDDGEFLYSKFLNGRPQIATSKDYNAAKKQGLKKILSYDEAGRLKLSKATQETPSLRTTTITTFKYDQCGNLIEKSDRTNQQEIQVGKKRKKQPTTSTKPTIEKVNYVYEYTGCLWTKKFKIVNDQKVLLAERSYE